MNLQKEIELINVEQSLRQRDRALISLLEMLLRKERNKTNANVWFSHIDRWMIKDILEQYPEFAHYQN